MVGGEGEICIANVKLLTVYEGIYFSTRFRSGGEGVFHRKLSMATGACKLKKDVNY